MKLIPGYLITEELYFGENSIVYRADKDNKSVIIKILQSEYPSVTELNAFREEYELLKNLDFPEIVKAIGTEKYRNSFAIVFEDIGGVALSDLLKKGKIFSVEDVLNISIKVARAISNMHKANIVHRDIKPHNIVVNEIIHSVNLIDFGSASLLARQNSFIPLNSSLEGTLLYTSPEQTGRMNRTVDYRTDLYSFGVTMYQLLTGELPFQYSNPIELVHAHIAKSPISPNVKNNTWKPLSNVVMKLLEKNPEDRYQNINGLIYDLEWCLSNLFTKLNEVNFNLNRNTETPNIEEYFKVGTQDFSPSFHIPEKLYGRQKEILRIMKSFVKTIAGSKELILISGSSGIGKTILINEVNKPIVEYNGYFVAGKYDQFKRSTPYRAIIYAMQNLVQQILTESDESISRWRDEISFALGLNAQIMIEVVPELENLIGIQEPVVALNAEDALIRFNNVFQNLLKVFCNKSHPVVIFLDDLQWADFPSLKLICEIISDPDIKYLLLLLSYRNNYSGNESLLPYLMDNIKKYNILYREIVINPISLFDISNMVSDTLLSTKEDTIELAEILFERTKGNPFFVSELFKSLHDKNLIYFADNRWQWDIGKIREQENISENVIDLMVKKIQELPAGKIEVLKLSACIGFTFKIAVLANVMDSNLETINTELTYLSNKGLFLISQENVRFIHDKVREATYTLISEEEKARNHYAIGNAFLNVINKTEIEETVFTIVNQLNQGSVFVTNSTEKERLLNLNLLAGDKAIGSTAYEEALQFIQKAIDLLPENSWTVTYELTLELYTKRARIAYLTGDIEGAEDYFSLILGKVKTISEEAAVCELQIPMYVSQNKLREALAIGIRTLDLLNISFPEDEDYTSEINKSVELLRNRSTKELLEGPLNYDSSQLAILRILVACVFTAYISLPSMCPLFTMSIVNISLEWGNFEYSCIGYAMYGNILCSVFGNYELGYEFGDLAIGLVNKHSLHSLKSSVNYVFATMINHWRHHAVHNIDYLFDGFQAGLQNGNSQFAAYNLNHYFIQMILVRKNISEIASGFEKYSQTLKKLKQEDAFLIFNLNYQFVLNLQSSNNSDLQNIQSELFDEQNVVEHWIDTKNASALYNYYLNKTILEYLFGSPLAAYKYVRAAEKYEAGCLGMMQVPEFNFWESLCCFSLLENTDSSESEKVEYLGQIVKNQKQLKIWSEICSANYTHKYFIIEGKLAVSIGDLEKARNYFKNAIRSSKKNEYLLEEAVANECYAEIWRSNDESLYSDIHLVEAYYAYMKWGCEPRLRILESLYPQLKKFSNRSFDLNVDPKINTEFNTRTNSNLSRNFLDLHTVIKSSQAISGEIQLEKLLYKMINILMENAGAEKGFFLLKENGRWYIKAKGNIQEENREVTEKEIFAENNELSIRIVNYVAHTKSIVLLNDAIRKGAFTNDEYIKRKHVKSLLCYPVLNQGNLLGVVYLENNLSADIFTSERVEILNILSAQIALSLENSLLYSSLEQKVTERTKDLEITLNNLKLTQNELIQSEKMAALGQLIAGIAHEINTPIGAISSSMESVQRFLKKDFMPVLEYFIKAEQEERDFMQNILHIQSLNKAFISSKEARKMRIKIENKLSENEVENSSIIADHLTDIGIYENIDNFIPILKKYGIKLIMQVYRLSILTRGLGNIQLATDKTAKIVYALKNYTHRESSVGKTRAKIEKGMDTVLVLYQNVLNRGIELVKIYEKDLPEIECYPDELNQVWVNIIQNAIYAMDSKGILKIRIQLENIYIKVEITDNGKGIPVDVQNKMFKPFYTTKPAGEGSGMGLGIVEKIIEKHQGIIRCESEPGKTKFIILIPIK